MRSAKQWRWLYLFTWQAYGVPDNDDRRLWLRLYMATRMLSTHETSQALLLHVEGEQDGCTKHAQLTTCTACEYEMFTQLAQFAGNCLKLMTGRSAFPCTLSRCDQVD